MEKSGNGKQMYVMYRIFLYFFMVLFIFQAGIGVANLVKVLSTKSEEIELEDTGYSYRFEGVIGYNQWTYLEQGTGGDLENPKACCVVFLVLALMTNNIPCLILLYYIHKILKRTESGRSPFVGEMVRDVNVVAGLLIGIGLCSRSVLALGMAVVSEKINVDLIDEMQFEWIFAGIIVFLFRDIFAHGCVLQQDVDETL